MEHRRKHGYRSIALILLTFGWAACATPKGPSGMAASSTDDSKTVASVAEKLPPVGEQPGAYPFFW
jgi:hypothetical protein